VGVVKSTESDGPAHRWRRGRPCQSKGLRNAEDGKVDELKGKGENDMLQGRCDLEELENEMGAGMEDDRIMDERESVHCHG